MRFRQWWAVALVMSAAITSARAAGFPERPVVIVLPFPAGAAADVMARKVSAGLSARWHQSVIVENKPGASTLIGAQAVLNSPRDGYTLLFTADQTLTTTPLLYRVNYDPARDFQPVSLIGRVPLVLVGRRDLPAADLSALLEQARQQPRKFTYGSSGLGSTQQLGFAELARLQGVELLHVPYQGQAPVVAALLKGEIDVAFSGASNVAPYIRSGALKALAVGAGQPLPTLPGVPTIDKAVGTTDFDITPWVGLIAPAGVPSSILDKIQDDVKAVLADKTLSASLEAQGFEVVGSGREEFQQVVLKGMRRWREVIENNHVSLDGEGKS